MSNSYFQFKHFIVHHDLCAMKVGTDGVLLGAWADCQDAQGILDIGTGSGLIALMLAQRSNASIVGIDLDENACKQAQINVEQSPFPGRIQIQKADFKEWKSANLYDLIVSNPPYFMHSLLPAHKARSLARHNDELPIEVLIKNSMTLLSPEGKIALILPYEQLEDVDKVAYNFGLYKTREVRVKPLQQSAPKRVLLEYSKCRLPLEASELYIEISRHKYSEEYITLIKNFYLKM